jgi:hypothetical protein
MLNMSKLMELAAIWLNDKVNVETEDGEIVNTLRITKGMHVYVNHGTILDVNENRPANYTIESLYGDIYSTQLEANLINNNGEILKLILK